MVELGTFAIHIDPLGYLFIKYQVLFVFLASDRLELNGRFVWVEFRWEFGWILQDVFAESLPQALHDRQLWPIPMHTLWESRALLLGARTKKRKRRYLEIY